MAAAPQRTFDIPETQILVHYPADPYPWHGRILVERTEGAVWIGYSPDIDDGPQPVDLAFEAYELLDRNSAIPPQFVAAGVYWFDPIDPAQFRRFRRAARVHAALLGAEDVAMPPEHKWRFSEATTSKFAEVVDSDVVQGNEFTELSGHALASVAGEIYRCELVGDGELEKWKTDKKKEDLDDRLIPETSGNESLSELMPSLSVAVRTWPMFGGPRATKEFLDSIAAGSGNFVSYHAEWVRLSGVSQHSPAVFSHRHDLEVLRLALHVDNLLVPNLACIEQVVRHLLQTEKAVARNPGAPDYSGLSVLTDGVVSSKGAAVTSSFDAWIAEKQKEKGKALQQERLYRDEMARPAKGNIPRAEGGEERAERASRKAKAKPKA